MMRPQDDEIDASCGRMGDDSVANLPRFHERSRPAELPSFFRNELEQGAEKHLLLFFQAIGRSVHRLS